MRGKFNLKLLVIPLLFIALGVIWFVNTDDNVKEEVSVSIGEENEESRSDVPSNNENDPTSDQLNDEEYYTSEFAKIRKADWEWIDSKENQYENVEQFLSGVDHYVKVISEYIGKQNWQEAYINKHPDKDEIKIEITGSTQGSYTAGGYNHYKYLQPKIFLSVSLFQIDKAPTAHELTHIIAPFYSSLSLREGLAQYTQDKFGKNPSVFNYGEPVIPMSKQFLTEEHADILDVIGTEGIYERAGVRDLSIRGVFYVLSYSFSLYLIEEFGIEKFMKVYEAVELDEKGNKEFNGLLYEMYKEVYGKSLEELKEAWIEYVLDYE